MGLLTNGKNLPHLSNLQKHYLKIYYIFKPHIKAHKLRLTTTIKQVPTIADKSIIKYASLIKIHKSILKYRQNDI